MCMHYTRDEEELLNGKKERSWHFYARATRGVTSCRAQTSVFISTLKWIRQIRLMLRGYCEAVTANSALNPVWENASLKLQWVGKTTTDYYRPLQHHLEQILACNQILTMAKECLNIHAWACWLLYVCMHVCIYWDLLDPSPTVLRPFAFSLGGKCPFWGIYNLLRWRIRDEVTPKHCIEVRKSPLSNR